mmetsp:Transcript_276/g.514  ORF Transcript_276/g.514 Transcript_276/m.514 type:complete len:270 (+) Transcript_276:123-932(+)
MRQSGIAVMRREIAGKDTTANQVGRTSARGCQIGGGAGGRIGRRQIAAWRVGKRNTGSAGQVGRTGACGGDIGRGAGGRFVMRQCGKVYVHHNQINFDGSSKKYIMRGGYPVVRPSLKIRHWRGSSQENIVRGGQQSVVRPSLKVRHWRSAILGRRNSGSEKDYCRPLSRRDARDGRSSASREERIQSGTPMARSTVVVFATKATFSNNTGARGKSHRPLSWHARGGRSSAREKEIQSGTTAGTTTGVTAKSRAFSGPLSRIGTKPSRY